MRLRPKLFSTALKRRLILNGFFALVLSGNLVFAQDSKQPIELKVKGEDYILVVTESRTLNVRQKASSLSPVVGSLLNGSTVPFTGITANDATNINGFWYQVEYLKGKLGWVSGDYSKKINIPKNLTIPQASKLDSTNEVLIKEIKTENPENLLRSTGIIPKPAVSPVVKLDSKNEVLIKETKTENPENLLRSTDVIQKPAVSQVAKLDSKNEIPIVKTKTENPENFLRSTDSIQKSALENKNDSAPIESQGFFKNLFSSKPRQTSKKPSQKEKVTGEKPWAYIDGFRSAKFGMRMQEVRKAIYKDFGVADWYITTINHPMEKTQSLAVTIEELLPNSGKSQVIYVFGYRSKLLMQVNIYIGHKVDESITAKQVVDSGNLLGNYLLQKRYLDDGLVSHVRLNDGSVLIFRGKDQKGRMALLRLSDQQSNNKNNEGLKIALNLSYIEKPGQPDIYKLEEGDF